MTVAEEKLQSLNLNLGFSIINPFHSEQFNSLHIYQAPTRLSAYFWDSRQRFSQRDPQNIWGVAPLPLGLTALELLEQVGRSHGRSRFVPGTHILSFALSALLRAGRWSATGQV